MKPTAEQIREMIVDIESACPFRVTEPQVAGLSVELSNHELEIGKSAVYRFRTSEHVGNNPRGAIENYCREIEVERDRERMRQEDRREIANAFRRNTPSDDAVDVHTLIQRTINDVKRRAVRAPGMGNHERPSEEKIASYRRAVDEYNARKGLAA